MFRSLLVRPHLYRALNSRVASRPSLTLQLCRYSMERPPHNSDARTESSKTDLPSSETPQDAQENKTDSLSDSAQFTATPSQQEQTIQLPPPQGPASQSTPPTVQTFSESSESSPSASFNSTPSILPPGSASAYLETARSRIGDILTQCAIQTRLKTDATIARLSRTFSRLGGELNRVTGYDAIEALKRQVATEGAYRLRPYIFIVHILPINSAHICSSLSLPLHIIYLL